MEAVRSHQIFLFSFLPCLPGMCVGSRMCVRSSSAAANVWRGRRRGTLRPCGGNNTRWRRRAMLCSTHAGPLGPRPWITSCRWDAGWRKKSDFFTVFYFNQTLFYFCIVTKDKISCLICCCFDFYWYNMQFYLFSISFSSFIYSLRVLYSFHVATVFGCECLHANQISSHLMC